jgi:hypothetical protein
MLLQQASETILHANERLVLELVVAFWILDYKQECQLKVRFRLTHLRQEVARLFSLLIIHRQAVKKSLLNLHNLVIRKTHFY